MTSVKDIVVDDAPGHNRLGRGTFGFSDRYSVFDWGPMPDTIPLKGASLCTMGAFNFELLADKGIPTHYRGVIPPGEESVTSVRNCETPPTEMAVDLATVPDLPETESGYDYTAFHEDAGTSYVVPLEVIFRNRVPVGSSLRRRRKPTDVGLTHADWPDTAVELDEPIIEFSTKFERSDRYLDQNEAESIAGVAELDAIESLARSVNEVITERAQETGFRHDDGKIEVVYHAGDLLVADVAGTFDENRFTFNDTQLSKEVIRQFYKRFDPDWVDAVDAAKAEAKAAGRYDWKALCDDEPDPLPPEVVQLAGDLYTAGTERYTGLGHFDDDLETVIDRLTVLLSED